MNRVVVAVEPPYDVVVGAGALADVGALLGSRRRVAVVSQRAIADRYADAVARALSASETFLIGDGEAAKTLATVDDLTRRFARWGLLRGDAVVALGGGVVGDTAGFAAAVYHRGITVVQAPTTLLAQLDASIGGKTGVNLPEGKNLVGAFYQPAAVLADTITLESLPEREYRSGLGEVAKYALMDADLADTGATGDTGDAAGDTDDGTSEARPGLAGLVRERADTLLARDPAVLTDLVTRCAAIKAAVVAADPHERTGRRATLNYGHTLAHALETAGGYRLTHGEAVAIGLVFAAQLAEALERICSDDVDRHRAVVSALELPTEIPRSGAEAAPGADELVALMQRDKKASGGLTFVLAGPSGLERVDDPPAFAVQRALRAVGVGP